VRHGAAQGAAVAHLRVAHPSGRVRQERYLGAGDLVPLEEVVPGAGADGHHGIGPGAVHPHVGQVGDAADVDQDGGDRQAQLHDRQERVAAGQELGVLAVLAEGGQRLVYRADLHVLERCGDHACTSCDCGTWPADGPAAAAVRTARTMLW
jgi:hypothetical protein